MDDKIFEFAPIILVVVLFIVQNNIFVRPEQLEKKHREIIDYMDNKLTGFKGNYVELNAYKEFQTHLYSELEKLSSGIKELKDFLMGKVK